MRKTNYWVVGAAVFALCAGVRASSAALLGGHNLETGWTGGTPFGAYIVNGLGTARATLAVPLTGRSPSFSTSGYASSTDTNTSVADTNIRITNSAGSGWSPPQWFQYVDVDNNLPDFRTLTYSIDTANTTVPGFTLARVQTQDNAIAIEFGEIAPGQTISVNVTPEPAGLALLSIVAAATLARRRRRVM